MIKIIDYQFQKDKEVHSNIEPGKLSMIHGFVKKQWKKVKCQ